ncbi:carbohydrate sulfotransferase 4-like [Limulus polyphemus]|uniref:Carbohydrate sulfotransferase 4-like n=1 Tax=Limulus polyphemus TaxID=6850 RepID=A0ABM1TSM0_LIMPO|nr:carbohydrate sulfotransferase 4-like [Limulus polyphemus]
MTLFLVICFVTELPQQTDEGHSTKILNYQTFFHENPRVLLLTYWRSGSTFLGEMLSYYPDTFYRFEPFMYLNLLGHVDSSQALEAVQVLKHLLLCDYTNAPQYFQLVKKEEWNSDTLLKLKNQSSPCHAYPKSLCAFRRNTWDCLRNPTELCLKTGLLENACRNARLLIIKTVRLRLRHAIELLKDKKVPNLHVIHLVRDPRGLIASRKQKRWCITPDCRDPRFLCRSLQDDLLIGDIIQYRYGVKYLRVRYEDVAMQPKTWSEKLLRFLNFPMHEEINKYVNLHTRKGNNHTFFDNKGRLQYPLTYRESIKTAREWTKKLTYSELQTIQNVCQLVIQKLGYRMIKRKGVLAIL